MTRCRGFGVWDLGVIRSDKIEISTVIITNNNSTNNSNNNNIYIYKYQEY